MRSLKWSRRKLGGRFSWDRDKKVKVEETKVVEYTPEEIAVRVRLLNLVSPRRCRMRSFVPRYLLKSGEDPSVCIPTVFSICSITVMHV